MRSRTIKFISLTLGVGLLLAYLIAPFEQSTLSPKIVKSTSSPKASVESKKLRTEYFFNMLKDPAINAIPDNIRQQELSFARNLPKHNLLTKSINGNVNFEWKEVGPTDVGGRTRALAIDRTNASTILAGGVSGGLWKSTDGGATWILKTAMNVPLSVTSIVQDPRDGQNNTWYYATGEFFGSAQDLGGQARFFGSGMYKSTDNGETWLFLSSTVPGANPIGFDDPFDFISKVIVDPTNGDVYAAANGHGILRSQDGGASFSLVLGGTFQHQWADVVVASDGVLLASISEVSFGALQDNSPGIYRSTNSGDNWTDITPVGFTATHDRTVLAIAPSNADVGYVYTFANASANNREVIEFYKISSIAAGTFVDRSVNLPDFGDPVGMVSTQGSYNMVLGVKPDDENFVLLGGTNLFRSTDGFATPANVAAANWIGGYAIANNISQFVNQHADQQALAFDPTDPDILWAGTDGGIARSADVTATPHVWEDKNNGYNVTQFYTVSIPQAAGNTNIIGGTQDNGSPGFDWEDPGSGSEDITSGDGAFAYFGTDRVYGSSQMGVVSRYSSEGNFQAELTPTGTSGQLFIHPFAVNPTGETVMAYPVANVMWRNDQVNTGSSAVGWTELTNIITPVGTNITALSWTTGNPSNRLYFAGSDVNTPAVPSIFKLDDAHTATDGAVDISIPGASSGAFVHNIAVNPNNGDEILVVLSNYGIVSLYHSSDGGATYTDVEGNLSGATGPSLRWAVIVPKDGGNQYVVATSVGVFSTDTLDGSSTSWIQEAFNEMGNVVVAALDYRTSDNTLAAATHGRGIFIGTTVANSQQITTDDASISFFNPGDDSQVLVSFNSGAVSGNELSYLDFGPTVPSSIPGGGPPNTTPVVYFSLNSTIPDNVPFDASVLYSVSDSQFNTSGVTNFTDLKLFRYDEDNDVWIQKSTTPSIINAGGIVGVLSTTTDAFSTWAVAETAPTGIEDDAQSPITFSLNQNAPNPFNPETQIEYSVPKQGQVQLVIYNVLGQEIRTLVNEVQSAGVYNVVWNGQNDLGRAVSSGVYLYRLTAGEAVESKRMTLLK